MSDFVRDAVLTALKAPCIQGYAQTLDERRLHFSDDEKLAVRQLRESAVFQAYPKEHLDRHEIKYLMGRLSTMPIGVCESAASKCEYCMGINLIDENLVWNQELAAEMSGITLVEGMASTDSGNTQAKDQGMYGVGDGADKPEPKGQLDTGTSQKSDHGDHSKTSGKSDGYVDEAQYEAAVAEMHKKHETERAALEGKMPPEFMKNKIAAGSDADGDGKTGEGKGKPDFSKMGKGKDEGELPDFMKNGKDKNGDDKDENYHGDMDFPKKKDESSIGKDLAPKANMAPASLSDKNTAATDARYKDGTKQNETVEEMTARHEAEKAALETAVKENTWGDRTIGPVSKVGPPSTPGDGAEGTKGKKGTSDGETPGSTPDYSKAKEQDPSNDPKNKGPVQAKNESFEDVEVRLCAILEEKGYERGTPQWDRAYKRGFDMWLHERARTQNGALVEV
jgi:hypothetical protein